MSMPIADDRALDGADEISEMRLAAPRCCRLPQSTASTLVGSKDFGMRSACRIGATDKALNRQSHREWLAVLGRGKGKSPQNAKSISRPYSSQASQSSQFSFSRRRVSCCAPFM
jgi:hypothetical protein